MSRPIYRPYACYTFVSRYSGNMSAPTYRILCATWWLSLLLIVFALPPVQADDVPGAVDASHGTAWNFLRDHGFTGALRLDYFRSSKDLDNATDFFGVTTQAKILPTFSPSLDGKIEARLTNPAIGDGGDTDSTLLEAYVTAHFEHAQLRIGKQIVAWGRADGLNPTDNLTPHDYKVLLPFEEDQRFGTTAIKLDAYLDAEYTLTVFTTPYFVPSTLTLPAGGATLVESRPEQRWSNSEVGIKLNKTADALDGSVSYYHGYNLLPELRPLGLTPLGVLFELRYTEIDVLGFDVARNFGRYGFRAEAAYIRTEDRRAQDPVGINPYVYVVAGGGSHVSDELQCQLPASGSLGAGLYLAPRISLIR